MMNENIPGKYIHQKNSSHYLELKRNGTYFLFEGSVGVTGTYEVNGTELTISGGESSSSARIQDGVITDAEGDRWIRATEVQQAAAAPVSAGRKPAPAVQSLESRTGSDDPLASMTWLPDILKRDLPWELIEAIVWAALLILLLIRVVNARS
jgi:hypothetical protein